MKKNEILKSGLTLTLCGALFIGSTLAFFVKSVESQGNVIKTSLLDVEFNYKDGDTWQPVDGSIFKDDKLSASQSITKEIQIKNTGHLPFKYDINLFRKEVEKSLLDKYIDVTIEKKNSDKEYKNTLKTALTPNQVEFESEYLLNNKDAHEYVITFSMNQTDQPLDAEIYSNKTLDEFDIQVIANQVSAPGAGHSDVKIEIEDDGTQVITANSKSAMNQVVNDILKENPNAKVEVTDTQTETIDGLDYFVYTVRISENVATIALDEAKNTNYKYVIVKVLASENPEGELPNIEGVPVIDQLKDGYYYYNSGRPYVAFKINEAIAGKNGDYILVEYFDANNKLVTSKSTKNLFMPEFLNEKEGKVVSGDNTGEKYPKRFSTDVPAGAYSTTLTSGGQNVKSIKVTVVKDGKSTSVQGGW